MKYYSELLKKPFDTVEELENAEKEKNEQINALKVKNEERTERAKEVENAYKKYIETKKKLFEEIDNSYNEYLKLRDKFVDDYGSFHMTYTNKDGEEKYSLTDAFKTVSDLFTELFGF